AGDQPAQHRSGQRHRAAVLAPGLTPAQCLGTVVMEQPVSLRWIYVHLIEEYARHNGHADLIRERIDGTTGT
ncbi:DUF664 domain-containing protein, partial [Streptomyces sp. NPDC052236]|uniref:mycothiol transferase n=1 Tax=Streptomyces sp. NPDC052236 TaxID=3365686 RepID=UPI0037D2C30A